MAHTRLAISDVGQIQRADVTFGDLTVLVGPQATGKSIFLQFLKLLVDTGSVLADLKRYGLDWDRQLAGFLDVYLGEGMHTIWRPGRSRIEFDGEDMNLEDLVRRQKKNKDERLFFIPAQRVMTFGKGWPRPFTDYSPGDPFAVRDFSEKMRRLIETEFQGDSLFPQKHRLKVELRRILNQTVFAGFGLRVDKYGHQKRLVLQTSEVGQSLPFMVWSAGQREFVPLLLGFYWLLPPTRTPRRGSIEWVVIEELEMGLHPEAISAVLLLVLDLLARGYRVCISTHSPHVLEVVWALQTFRRYRADPKGILDLFGVRSTPTMNRLAERLLTKSAQVYYFNRRTGETDDISDLDPGAQDQVKAGWGGLTEFSGRVADAVAEVVARAGE